MPVVSVPFCYLRYITVFLSFVFSCVVLLFAQTFELLHSFSFFAFLPLSRTRAFTKSCQKALQK